MIYFSKLLYYTTFARELKHEYWIALGLVQFWKNSKLFALIDARISEHNRRRSKNGNFTILYSNCVGGTLYLSFIKVTINQLSSHSILFQYIHALPLNVQAAIHIYHHAVEALIHELKQFVAGLRRAALPKDIKP